MTPRTLQEKIDAAPSVLEMLRNAAWLTLLMAISCVRPDSDSITAFSYARSRSRPVANSCPSILRHCRTG